MRPDIHAMTNVEYLEFRGRNEGITITDADLAHARHEDTGCPICAGNRRTAHATAESVRKTESARAVLIGGLHEIDQYLGALRTNQKLGTALPSSEDLISSLEKALKKLRQQHSSVWSK